MGTAAQTTRNTARVLLVDDDQAGAAVPLLARCRPRAAGPHEDIGLSLTEADLGPVVARSSGEWGWERRFFAVDSFFYVRVPALSIDTAGFQPEEQRLLSAHRWWSRSEIEAATEPVLPIGLRPLLDRLLSAERPIRP